MTHYVGVAGVGPDAGRLPADDPRAGVFGYGRQTRLEDITAGSSQHHRRLGRERTLRALGCRRRRHGPAA